MTEHGTTAAPGRSTPPQDNSGEGDPRATWLDLSPEEQQAWLQAQGQPPFRAAQIREWIYRRHARNFAEMTNLPRALRQELDRHFRVWPLEPLAQVVSQDRSTQKVVFRLADGQTIETVLMLYRRRRTLCISSQVGCAMGCTFCATAQGGLARNLTVGEMVAQVLYFARYLADPQARPDMAVERPTRVTHIVLMGMGEPMHNYRSVWAAIRLLTHPEAFGLGARHITLSTVGLVPMIDRMAEEGLQVNLAVSLHAPNDELRSQLVPINRRWPVEELLAAVRRYVDRTHRRVTFEYALMRGVNDSPALAQELAQRLQGILCHVNLIPWNPIPHSPFQPTSPQDTRRFAQVLRAHGIPTTVRLRRGIEIDAGCGQLRRRLAQQGQAAA